LSIAMFFIELNEIMNEYEVFRDRGRTKRKLGSLLSRVKKAAKNARNLRENKEYKAIIRAIEELLKGL